MIGRKTSNLFKVMALQITKKINPKVPGFGGIDTSMSFGGNKMGAFHPIIQNYLNNLSPGGGGGFGGFGATAGTGNLGSNPQNPYTVFGTTKSNQLGEGINVLYGNNTTDNAANRSVLEGVNKEFAAARPGMRGVLDQESNAINEYFNGGVQNHLDKLARDQAFNVRQGTSRALDRVKRNFNLGTMAGRTGSYLNKQAMDSAGGIMANSAMQLGDLARNNYLYAKEGQNRLLGQRNNALTSFIQGGLAPIDWRNSVAGSEISRLGGVGALEHGNTVYNQETPESAMGRKLDMLARLQQFQENFPQQNYTNNPTLGNFGGLRRLYA